MIFNDKSVTNISDDEIDNLVNEHLTERQHLEFKVTNLVGLSLPKNTDIPQWQWKGIITGDNVLVDKFVFESEKGIEVPALLFSPKNPHSAGIVIVHASDKEKPTGLIHPSIPVMLVRE
jgi:hypothetical protein